MLEHSRTRFVPVLGLAALAGCLAMSAAASEPRRLRLATFNVQELSRAKLDDVDARGHGQDPQLRKAAEIIQRVRPDVLLINEIDFDEPRRNARLFIERYLAVSQAGLAPLAFPHVFFEPVNTGVPSGRDLDKDGSTTSPGDAHGYGRYPGQYGMALLSRLPLDSGAARSFRLLPWRVLPGHLIPDGQAGRPAFYTPEDVAVLRLSSKSHWLVPVSVGATRLWVLAAHPTPPIFDGPEDRNGRRMFDELRLLADIIRGGPDSAYLVDDNGQRGALPSQALFVVMGDLNAEPDKDEARYGRSAISQLLSLPRVQDPRPSSAGGGLATCEFGRIDYVLPARELSVHASGVFWPAPGDPLRALVDPPQPASDHRLVWVDVELPAQ
jgi:endonuclease/exonuclease/phosphatase family metal-dependent hydrolase